MTWLGFPTYFTNLLWMKGRFLEVPVSSSGMVSAHSWASHGQQVEVPGDDPHTHIAWDRNQCLLNWLGRDVLLLTGQFRTPLVSV